MRSFFGANSQMETTSIINVNIKKENEEHTSHQINKHKENTLKYLSKGLVQVLKLYK